MHDDFVSNGGGDHFRLVMSAKKFITSNHLLAKYNIDYQVPTLISNFIDENNFNGKWLLHNWQTGHFPH